MLCTVPRKGPNAVTRLNPEVVQASGQPAGPLRDLGEPGRFVEQIVDPSWNDHLRRFSRITAADAALRERKLAFHIGESPPVVTRSVMESTVKGG